MISLCFNFREIPRHFLRCCPQHIDEASGRICC